MGPELDVEPGEVVALVGPNGAGKSTLLRAMAEGRPGTGLMFQDRLLFPHLSAIDNVAFGLRRQGAKRKDARAQARSWLDRLGAADLADRKPATLSGGEASRVALARALAPRPDLLLLDEPFAAVDLAARPTVRRAIRAALAEHHGACVLVTHQPVDVLALAQRMVVMEDGRIVQDGPVAEVTARPRSPWAAEMAGLNLLSADLVHAAEPRADARWAVIHPRAVTLSRHRPEGSARNVWPATVADIDHEGERARVRLDIVLDIVRQNVLVAEVTAAALGDLGLAPGGQVWASVKATEVTVYEA
jgi:molybdate transport system ATP-binding protein